MPGIQPRTGPKPRHSKTKIALAAIALADAEGMASVSIRAVAAKIGAAPASLYRYLDSHEELSGLMVEQISAEYELESHTGSAAHQLLGLATQGLRIMRRHPWTPGLAMGKHATGPNTLAYLERGLTALDGSGLDAGAKLQCLAMLNAMTTAFALNEQEQQQPQDSAALFTQLETGSYPHLSAALAHAATPVDQQAAFEAAIMNYLRGAGIIRN